MTKIISAIPGISPTMAKTILVTGATGTVGSEVVNQLSNVKSDFKIKAAVHSVEDAKKIQNFQKVEPIQMDYDTQEGLQAAFKEVDKLFLLTHASPKSAVHETNLITEAKKSGTRHIVKQSIMGADLKADVEAMRLHRQTEKVIEESGIPYTFLRPNEFMQGFINFQASSIKNNGAFYVPAEDSKVSFVDARDIASVAVKALVDGEEHFNKTYMITGSEALSYYRAAEILSKATGKKIDYVNISDEEARGAMKEVGLDDWLIDTISDLYTLYRKGYASHVSRAIEDVTGKKPKTFAQFAKDYAEAFR